LKEAYSLVLRTWDP